MSLGIYVDASLETPLVGNFSADHELGSTTPAVFQFWVGDPDTGYTYDDQSDPGVTPIAISITDTNEGSGHEAAEITLATTFAGLSGATAGDPLSIGTTLVSGPSGAAEVWMSVLDATGVAAVSTELGIETQSLRQVVT